MNLHFKLDATDGAARAGRFQTPHGEVRTPVFMPVGTQGTVKAVLPRDLAEAGAQVVLANAYHLWLRPGHDLVRELGGLHRFMRWDGPILTDSGGFQVLSLTGLRKIDADGVHFRSHLDGSKRYLTPELAIEIENALGADIIMPLDICPPAGASEAEVRIAVERSLKWLQRCKSAHARVDEQALFGIVQGGISPELRRRSADETVDQEMDGYSIGGLAIGEQKEATYDTILAVTERLPIDQPRYVMGMGTPLDLFAAVGRGVDMFDSVLPTRNARNAGLFTRNGRLNMRNASFKLDDQPIDAACGCHTCQNFSRAYVRHLVVAGEILACVLMTIHNLHFFLDTMDRIRQAISSQRFEELRREFLSAYGADPERADRGRVTTPAVETSGWQRASLPG